jgi:IclR family transcriptional regulator, pca regulon regulatory protein
MNDPAAASRHRRNFLKTIDRGLRFLDNFSVERPALTLSELSAGMALDPGTVYRFVYTFEHLGYIRREPGGAYRLTSRVLDLARSVQTPDELHRLALPHMEALQRQVEETVSLAVRDGGDIVVLEQVESLKPVSVRRRLGDRQPAHCTAQGKVLLAYLTDELQDALLPTLDLQAFGPRTITRLSALKAELDRTRRRGYAINNDEMDAGLRAVAMPICARDGSVAAALSVDAPAGRMSMAQMQASFNQPLAVAAAAISAALGFTPRVGRDA